MMMITRLFVGFLASASFCLRASKAFVVLKGTKPTSSSSSSLYFEKKSEHDSQQPQKQQQQEQMRIDTSALAKNENAILTWLSSLSEIERSEPVWFGGDVLAVSPSMLVQEHLESLMPNAPSNLFPTEWSKAKFDFEWRWALFKGFSGEEFPYLLQYGRSNSHPLRLQLVAVPPHTHLALHVHPAMELDIPIFGDLWEHSSNILLPNDSLERSPYHSIGTPLSEFHDPPLPEELKMVTEELSKQTVLRNHGRDGRFHTHKITQGDCLVNYVGSIHQSFTQEPPCLLLVLGPNLHSHFLPGNFQQLEGIDQLTGIDHLLE